MFQIRIGARTKASDEIGELEVARAHRRIGPIAIAERVVAGNDAQVVLEPENEEYLHPGAHRDGTRSALDGAECRSTDTGPFGHHFRAEIPPELGKTKVLPESARDMRMRSIADK